VVDNNVRTPLLGSAQGQAERGYATISQNVEDNVETRLDLRDLDSKTRLSQHDNPCIRLPTLFLQQIIWLTLLEPSIRFVGESIGFVFALLQYPMEWVGLILKWIGVIILFILDAMLKTILNTLLVPFAIVAALLRGNPILLLAAILLAVRLFFFWYYLLAPPTASAL
jgi:hypothetical protein